MRIDV
ncbi:hypothetical protein VCHC41A1_2242, partial [Vibrio cholerae HC-41A1]